MTLRLLLGLVSRRLFAGRQDLLLENLALRQQLAVWQRTRPRPRLRWRDRWFWVGLARCWSGWRSVLAVVQPATVLRWHRQGFRLYWRWKSRANRADLRSPTPSSP